MRSIAIRDELTDEWRKRGVREQREYAILTAEISQATFGLTPSQYAEFKRVKRENLRDHMFDYVAREKLPALADIPKTQRLARLREIFERLCASEHPVRGCLFSLKSLEPVRIIEVET
jgi:hypothetical protein